MAQHIKIEPNSGLGEEQLQSMIAAAQQHASSNQAQSEVEQYRLTCRKLVEECRRELDLPGLAQGLDKAAAAGWLGQVGERLEREDLEAVRGSLKELNQFILRLRLARPAAEA
jgi:hypothetical protein